MAGYVGDKRKIEQMRSSFRDGKYGDVIASFNSLTYPERLSEAQRKIIELARSRIGLSPKTNS